MSSVFGWSGRPLSTADVARATGLTERQLRWLTRPAGPARPLLAAAGRGSAARYGTADVLRLACVADISRLLGVDLRGRWVSVVCSALAHAPADGVLVLTAAGAYVTGPGELGPMELGVRVELSGVATRLQRRLV